MSHQALLWALGCLAALFGAAALAMAVRRRKPRRARLRVRVAPPPVLEPEDEPDGAADEGAEAAPAKICPQCGSRYGSHYRTCERDDHDLAAIN